MVIAFAGFDSGNLNTVANPEHQGFGTIPVAIAITLWAYIGLESASLTGGEIKNPNRNVQRSTIIGFSITAVLYILTAVTTMGSLPQEQLAHAAAPMSDIINHITGARWGGWFVALGVIIAASGTISGWVLTTARTAFAAGEEKLFPSFFARVHPRFATPDIALIISGILTNVLLSLNYVQSLTEAFDFLILLATLTFMPAYSFSAAAQILLDNKDEKSMKKVLLRSVIPMLAFVYCIYATYSAGATMAMYGFLLMLSGIPVYVFMKLKRIRKR
jgi:Amino acid transporters